MQPRSEQAALDRGRNWTLRTCLLLLGALFLFGTSPADTIRETNQNPRPKVPASQRQWLLPEDPYVRSVLQRWVDTEGRSPGIAVGIIDAKGPRVLTYGRSGNPARPQIDADTLFELGSITKTFTATLLAEMVKRGEVELGTPLRNCLQLRFPTPGAGEITLKQLATHTSGLTRLPLDDPAFLWSMMRKYRDPYRYYSRQHLLDYLERCKVNPTLPHKVEYSNLGMGVLGEALAHKAHTDYATLLRERVLQPLGMSDTWVQVPAARQTFFAAGHNVCGDRVAHWDLPALAGAGALRSSVSDMLKYLAANLNFTPPIDPILHEVKTPEEAIAVGLGWLIIGPGDAKCVWHNGGTGGFTSCIAFYPAQKMGVVILNNSNQSVDELALHLLDPQNFKLEFTTEWRWVGVPLLAFGLAGWRARQPVAPSTAGRRRWYIPAPMGSKWEVAENILETVIVAVFVWKAWPWAGSSEWMRLGCVLLLLLVSVRLMFKAGDLPWAGPWGWARWGYHGVNLLVCILLAVFILFSF